MSLPVIYILTNKTNCKKYVGLARKSFASRLKSHKVNTKSLIGKALRKYGIDQFSIQQIAYAKEELNYWEKYFIDKLNTRHPNGYNLTEGGDGLCNPVQEVRDRISEKIKALPKPKNFSFKGKKHSEEERKKISDSMRIALSNPETKRKMKESAKKKPPISEESRKKISVARKGVPRKDAYLFSQRQKEVCSRSDYVNPMKGKKRPDLSERNKLGIGIKRWPNGRVFSEQHLRNISKAQTARWAKSKLNIFEKEKNLCRK